MESVIKGLCTGVLLAWLVVLTMTVFEIGKQWKQSAKPNPVSYQYVTITNATMSDVEFLIPGTTITGRLITITNR